MEEERPERVNDTLRCYTLVNVGTFELNKEARIRIKGATVQES